MHIKNSKSFLAQTLDQLTPTISAQRPQQALQNGFQWNWDRIRQVQSPAQLSPKDIFQKRIICYQMTGKLEIDSQVTKIANIFCDKYFGKISEKFQFIFLTPNRSVLIGQEEQCFFVIFDEFETKYIPMNKYINRTLSKQNTKKIPFVPAYSLLMKRILKQLNKFEELSSSNIREHLDLINCPGRDSYQLLVLAQSDDNAKVKQAKNILESFLKGRQVWSSEIINGIVRDTPTKNVLGLSRQEVQKNKVYLLAPSSDNLIESPDHKFFKIESKQYTLIPAEKISESFIFPPIPPHLSTESYILKVNIDLNQTRPERVDEIYSFFNSQNLKCIPKLLNYSKGQQSIEITIQKNNYDNIVNVYDSNCMYSDQSKLQLLSHSHVWKYPHSQLDLQHLQEFVSQVINPKNSQQQAKKNQLQFYRSQPETESVRKNSKLITGETRSSVLKNNKEDKVVFHFSKSCHSCKRFGGLYEQIASQVKDVRFYRIDNDNNKSQGLKNYNSTPIFMYYKKQMPMTGWSFKMSYFTKALFSNFVEITKEVKILHNDLFEKHLEEFKKNQSNVRQTIKEFI